MLDAGAAGQSCPSPSFKFHAVSARYSHANTPPMPPRLNLKQRLAALSQATSSPTTPRSHSFDSIAPQISTETLRRKLNIPWARREPSDIYQDDDAVRDVMSKMIFQAGVDYEWVLVGLYRCAHSWISQNKVNVRVEIRPELRVLTFISITKGCYQRFGSSGPTKVFL